MKRIIIYATILFLALSYETIEASPLLMVEAEGLVDGYTGEPIGSKIVELKISDEDYYFEVQEDEEITDWFSNIPEGLEAYVSSVNGTQLYVSFEGTTAEEADEQIEVTVPDGFIIDSNSSDSIGDLENTPSEKAVYKIISRNPLALYDRESIITGYVGEKLERQKVYIRLEDTTAESSMMGHEFPLHNGLLPVVIEIQIGRAHV